MTLKSKFLLFFLWLIWPLSVRSESAANIACIQPQHLVRSADAYATDELNLTDNTVALTPASYASWEAFLDANSPLTGKIFLLGAGDYRSWGSLNIFGSPASGITEDGNGTATRRIVFKYNGPGAHLPACMRPNNVANQAVLQTITLTGSLHYLFHGLKIDNTAVPTQYAVLVAPSTPQSENIIFEWMWLVDCTQDGFGLRDCATSAVQHCRIERIMKMSEDDRIGVLLENVNRDTPNCRIVGNQIVNYSDGVQTFDSANSPETLFADNLIIADNEFIIEPSYAAMLSGSEQLEDAIDIKVGSDANGTRIFIRRNRVCGYYPYAGESGGAGEGISISNDADWVEVADNVFDDCQVGIFVNGWTGGTPNATRHVTILRNKFLGIHEVFDTTYGGNSIAALVPTTITDNVFRNGTQAHAQAPAAGSHTYSGNTYSGMGNSSEP